MIRSCVLRDRKLRREPSSDEGGFSVVQVWFRGVSVMNGKEPDYQVVRHKQGENDWFVAMLACGIDTKRSNMVYCCP